MMNPLPIVIVCAVFLIVVTSIVIYKAFLQPFLHKLATSRANNSWSKPFKSKLYRPGYSSTSEAIMRYNEVFCTYQAHDLHGRASNWEEVSHVRGNPLEIKISNFHKDGVIIKFNPYEYFEDPTKPSDDELAAFSIEHAYDYNMAVDAIKGIIT